MVGPNFQNSVDPGHEGSMVITRVSDPVLLVGYGIGRSSDPDLVDRSDPY